MKNIPQFLRERQCWYATETPDTPPPGARFIPLTRRLSPITLSDLRPDRLEDYTDFDTAVRAVEDHPHWLGGVGIRIVPPLLVIVIRYCFQPSGTLDKPTRALMKGLSGYWERSPVSNDVQGIVVSPAPMVGDWGWFNGHRVLIFSHAHCNLTGEHFRGVAGDPGPANYERLAQFLKEIHR